MVDLGAQFYKVLVLTYKDLDTATGELLFQENLKEPQVTEFLVTQFHFVYYIPKYQSWFYLILNVIFGRMIFLEFLQQSNNNASKTRTKSRILLMFTRNELFSERNPVKHSSSYIKPGFLLEFSFKEVLNSGRVKTSAR